MINQNVALFKLSLEFFTNAPQYKNANIAIFVLAVPFKIKKTNIVWNLEM